MKTLRTLLAVCVALILLGVMACSSGGSSDSATPTSAPADTTGSGTQTGTEDTSTADTADTVDPDKPFKDKTLYFVWNMDLLTNDYAINSIYRQALDEWAIENEANWEQIITGDIIALIAMTASGSPMNLGFGLAFPRVANVGIVQEINDYYDYFADKYGSVFVDGATYMGNTYGVAMPWTTYSMLRFDATWCEENGVKSPKEYFLEGNWNFETFAEFLKQCTTWDEDGNIVTRGMGMWQFSNIFAYPVSIDPLSGRVTSVLDSERNRAAYQMLYELTEYGAVSYLGDPSTPAGHNSNNWGAMHAEDGYPIMGQITWQQELVGLTGVGHYRRTDDGNWADCVPPPVWRDENDPGYEVNVAAHVFGVLKTGDLDMTISYLDFLLAAGCYTDIGLMANDPSWPVGLFGHTPLSAEFIETRRQTYFNDLELLKDNPYYDPEYVQLVSDYILGKAEENKHFTWGFDGLGTNLTSDRWNFSELWNLPAASSIASANETLNNQINNYHRLYLGLSD